MNGSQYIPYATVALICVAALIHFGINIRKYAPDSTANRFYFAAVISSAVFAFMEFLFVFHESGIITNLIYCYTSEIMYSSASLISAFFWFMCSELEQNARTVSNLKRRIICAVPIVLMLLFTFTTPWHHLLFYFTPEGHYVRGILSTPMVVVTAIYIAKSGFYALFKSFKSEYYLKRKDFLTFFYYALGLIVSQVFQIVLGSVLPFRIIGAAVVFYLVQEDAIKNNVYIDRVTEANNRTAMDHYLKTHFEDADDSFAFVMIDLDNFKQVNDRYGHSTGDAALSVISSAFKAAIPSQVFFGRFGGDEFVIIGDLRSMEDLDCIINDARRNIAAMCSERDIPVCPEFSFGVCHKTPDIGSIPDMINRADAEMYRLKRERKAAR